MGARGWNPHSGRILPFLGQIWPFSDTFVVKNLGKKLGISSHFTHINTSLTITCFPIIQKEVKSRIPASADVVEGAFVSACEEEVQTITLSWSDDGYDWEISLRFEATEDSYALTNFSGNVSSGK